MLDMDPCLFYRVNQEETTYIMLFVDDTYIYSNDQKYIDEVISRMGKYYEVTLDTLGSVSAPHSFFGALFSPTWGTCVVGKLYIMYVFFVFF